MLGDFSCWFAVATLGLLSFPLFWSSHMCGCGPMDYRLRECGRRMFVVDLLVLLAHTIGFFVGLRNFGLDSPRPLALLLHMSPFAFGRCCPLRSCIGPVPLSLRTSPWLQLRVDFSSSFGCQVDRDLNRRLCCGFGDHGKHALTLRPVFHSTGLLLPVNTFAMADGAAGPPSIPWLHPGWCLLSSTSVVRPPCLRS